MADMQPKTAQDANLCHMSSGWGDSSLLAVAQKERFAEQDGLPTHPTAYEDGPSKFLHSSQSML